jgi:hypothetical protein
MESNTGTVDRTPYRLLTAQVFPLRHLPFKADMPLSKELEQHCKPHTKQSRWDTTTNSPSNSSGYHIAARSNFNACDLLATPPDPPLLK